MVVKIESLGQTVRDYFKIKMRRMLLYKDSAIGPLHLLQWLRLFLLGSKEEALILIVDLFVIVYENYFLQFFLKISTSSHMNSHVMWNK